ncbi:hypothetical protein GQ55_2G416800 [Panicum hallii var. hallii]|uniref:Uncharacterized protein n=1 Tax=Panicum hallii var. hallii TaxID=1504633 RepID=A0A2T7EY13_9POAL|nr:hypothetical protein GQ55_2G416800 [Panicum hallii var. hallii]
MRGENSEMPLARALAGSSSRGGWGRCLVGGGLGEETLLRGATVTRAGAAWEADGGWCLVIGGLGKERLLRGATFVRAGAAGEAGAED